MKDDKHRGLIDQQETNNWQRRPPFNHQRLVFEGGVEGGRYRFKFPGTCYTYASFTQEILENCDIQQLKVITFLS